MTLLDAVSMLASSTRRYTPISAFYACSKSPRTMLASGLRDTRFSAVSKDYGSATPAPHCKRTWQD